MDSELKKVIIDLTNGDKVEGIILSVDKVNQVIKLSKAKKTYACDASEQIRFESMDISKSEIKEINLITYELEDEDRTNINAIPESKALLKSQPKEIMTYDRNESFYDNLNLMSCTEARKESKNCNEKNKDTFNLKENKNQPKQNNKNYSLKNDYYYFKTGYYNTDYYNSNNSRGKYYYYKPYKPYDFFKYYDKPTSYFRGKGNYGYGSYSKGYYTNGGLSYYNKGNRNYDNTYSAKGYNHSVKYQNEGRVKYWTKNNIYDKNYYYYK